MSDPVFYRAFLQESEDGLRVSYEMWFCHKETECFYMCTRSPPQYKRAKFKRIHKHASRFAQGTQEKALEHLVFRKRRQQTHLRRQLAFNEAFLEGEIDELGAVLATQDLVHEHLNFDC